MTNDKLKEHDIVKLESGELGTIVHIYTNDDKHCIVETDSEVKTVPKSELTKI